MTTSENDLKKMAALAHLTTDEHSTQQLAMDVSAIMDFVLKLRDIDTTDVAPLHHPLNFAQRLRPDEIKEQNVITALESMAPLFADGLYLVPKVIHTGK